MCMAIHSIRDLDRLSQVVPAQGTRGPPASTAITVLPAFCAKGRCAQDPSTREVTAGGGDYG
jgi:hypothetical protein